MDEERFMKVAETVVVFERGGLMDSEPWARMHETIIGAVNRIVHPPGSDCFVIRRRVPKLDVQGRPRNRLMWNGLVSIKRQFLANLRAAVCQSGGNEDLDGLGELARAGGNLLMVEYPSGRWVSCDDEDFGALLRWEAGGFDALFVTGYGLRCVVKLEGGKPSGAHYSVGKLCGFMQSGLVDCGVLIVLSDALAKNIKGAMASWDIIDSCLPVWRRMGDRVERGLFAAIGIE
jgi:hypothetical protein